MHSNLEGCHSTEIYKHERFVSADLTIDLTKILANLCLIMHRFVFWLLLSLWESLRSIAGLVLDFWHCSFHSEFTLFFIVEIKPRKLTCSFKSNFYYTLCVCLESMSQRGPQGWRAACGTGLSPPTWVGGFGRLDSACEVWWQVPSHTGSSLTPFHDY